MSAAGGSPAIQWGACNAAVAQNSAGWSLPRATYATRSLMSLPTTYTLRPVNTPSFPWDS